MNIIRPNLWYFHMVIVLLSLDVKDASGQENSIFKTNFSFFFCFILTQPEENLLVLNKQTTIVNLVFLGSNTIF